MRTILSLMLGVAILTISIACHRNAANANDEAEQTPAPTPHVEATPQTDFERSLKFVRDGSYTYIYVFSRKDGKPLEADDSQFLRTNASQVVDWVTTADKKKVIGGTNFNLEEGNMAALKKRFLVEDYSGK